jgi:hypothetical protein
MKFLRCVGVAALIVLLTTQKVLAVAHTGAPTPFKFNPRHAATIIDNDDHMNVNNLDMVVTNHGSIAYDLITGNAGLIYPKGSTRTAVFAAGLWLGGKVVDSTGTDLRVAIGEYSQEFTPGPMAGGTFQADQPAFRNYRIERGDTTSSDYLGWPVDQGAPIDCLGNPLLLGDVTIWSVFNDADPGVHTNMNTDPLGVEVQQTVFAYNRAGPLGNIIFVKWKFINKGGNNLDSMYCSVWSDPDLGGFTDDLVGCDTTRSLGYCYNATNADGQYGSRPPAVGFDFMRGPIVQVSPGVFDTLGMTSFNRYINGTDPATAVETYNYMRGVKADSSFIHVFDDPNLPITTYQVSGLDPGLPSSPTNWLDSNPADRRLFLSSGPVNMAPGDSQEVVTAIIIGQGSDRIQSVYDMKNKDDVAQLVFDLNFDICAPPPEQPTADAGGPYSGMVGIAITFDGSGSTDPDADPLAYSWSFGDGSAAGTGVTPTHTYIAAGNYTAALTVTDPTSLSSTDTASVTIAATASAFTTGGNKTTSLAAGKPYTCIQVEAVDGSFMNSDLDLSSIRMISVGTGSVSQIFASRTDPAGPASKTTIDSDKNRNGIAEITACFKKSDLRLLFSALPAGPNTVSVDIRGDLITGSAIHATLTMVVKSTGGALAISVSPNPLNPRARLTFATSRPGAIRVHMFDPQGRLVMRIADTSVEAGDHDFSIEGETANGTKLASGVYFLKVWTQYDGQQVKRVTILK